MIWLLQSNVIKLNMLKVSGKLYNLCTQNKNKEKGCITYKKLWFCKYWIDNNDTKDK